MHCPKKGAETARWRGSWQVTATLEKAAQEAVGISSGRNEGIVRACAQQRGSCQGTHNPSTLLILLYLCSYFSKCLYFRPPHRMYSNFAFRQCPLPLLTKEGYTCCSPNASSTLENPVSSVYIKVGHFSFPGHRWPLIEKISSQGAEGRGVRMSAVWQFPEINLRLGRKLLRCPMF